MFLSDNSRICFSFESVAIFLLIMGYIFLHLYMPGNLWLNTRHCKFHLNGCCIFCISINFFELCSRK